jgi:hypothetical protein
MSKKMKVTITIDEPLFNSFKEALPDYVSVSGILETFIKEYMAGLYRCEWSLSEMIDVLRGKTTADYLQRVHDFNLRGRPADEIAFILDAERMEEFDNPHPKKVVKAEAPKDKAKAKKKE